MSTRLKRSSSVPSQATSAEMSGNQLPPLPDISAGLMLEVFTHRSLVLDEMDDIDSFRDNQRLAALGERVMQLALADLLYHRKPSVKAADFDVSS